MELKTLLGDDLYAQVEAKINEHNAGVTDKTQHVRYADLSEGGYVSKEKYKELETTVTGLNEQLSDANKEIESYKDMDIDGIKQAAANWETKYNQDTQALNKKLETERKEHAAERYLSGQKIRSTLARRAIMQDFLAADLPYKDGAFVGADDYMKKVRENYPDDFETDGDGGDGGDDGKSGIQITTIKGSGTPKLATPEQEYMSKKYGKNKYL